MTDLLRRECSKGQRHLEWVWVYEFKIQSYWFFVGADLYHTFRGYHAAGIKLFLNSTRKNPCNLLSLLKLIICISSLYGALFTLTNVCFTVYAWKKKKCKTNKRIVWTILSQQNNTQKVTVPVTDKFERLLMFNCHIIFIILLVPTRISIAINRCCLPCLSKTFPKEV